MHFEDDNILYRTIGINIKRYREQAGLTQTELADAAQISISYISKIEAERCYKSMSISVLNQLANVLKTNITNFFKET